MKHALATILLITSMRLMAQDPTCDYYITVRDTDMERYQYSVLVDEFTPEPGSNFDIKSFCTYPLKKESLKVSIVECEGGKTVIRSHSKAYCHPTTDSKLIFAIARRHIATTRVECMYFIDRQRIGRFLIYSDQFIPGERKIELYASLDANYDWDWEARNFLEANMIIVK